MAKIRNKQTGEIIEVPDNELGSYGLSTDSPIVKISPTPNQNQTSNTPSNTPDTLTGFTVDQHRQALKSAIQTGNKKLIDGVTGLLEKEQEYQAEIEKKDPSKVEIKGATATSINFYKDMLDAAQEAQKTYKPGYTGLLDSILGSVRTKTGIGDKEEVAFRQQIQDARTAVRQKISGAAIPKAEGKEFLDLIPKASDSDKAVQQKLEGLQQIALRKIENALQTAGHNFTGEEYTGQTVQTIDPKKLEPESKTGNPITDTIGNNRILNFLLGTGSKIAQDVGAGVRNIQSQDDFKKLEAMAQDWEDKAYSTKNMEERKVFLQNANQIRQQISGEARDISGSFTEEVNDNPLLRSVLGATEVAGAAELPGMTAGLKKILTKTFGKQGAKQIEKEIAEQSGKQVVETATGDVAKTSVDELNPLDKVFNKTAEIMRGGGSKQYIRNTVTKGDDVIPQNQILREDGVLGLKTNTKRLEANAKAMNKYGKQLEGFYSKSKETFSGDEVRKIFDEELAGQGYDDESIKFISDYLKKSGEWSIKTGDEVITPEQVWKAVQRLEKHPPKMPKNPESTKAFKELSKDAARIMRQKLYDKVPEARNINQRYSAHADYFDTAKDSSGIGKYIIPGGVGAVTGGASIGLMSLLFGNRDY